MMRDAVMTTPATLLVVDDEPGITYSLKSTLTSPQLTVLTAGTAAEGLAIVRSARPHVVLLDVRLPDLTGLQAFAQMHAIDPRLPVIIMTAFARTETAIEAMRLGAFEYLLKPVDLRRLREVVQQALAVSRLNRVPAVLESDPEESADSDLIVGQSPAMQDVYKAIGRIAPQDSTVLIQGESGTGKELVARALFHYSRRNQQPFLAINCAALPEALLESELFGHERGAFTGADQRRIGKFEQVNGGTIFLDEIGDMSPGTQAKALRLLQDQQFERVGGNTTVQTNVRIIAATNRDLTQMVAAGEFRQDLLYRLNGFTINLPPLRERLTDIPILAAHFLRRFNLQLGRSVQSFAPEVLEALAAHTWPGNVREFESAIRYALVQSTGMVITVDNLPPSCLSSESIPVQSQTPGSVTTATDLATIIRRHLEEGTGNLYRTIGQEVDRILLTEALAHFQGNQLQTAERLGISRMTLRTKLRSLDLGAAESADDDDDPT